MKENALFGSVASAKRIQDAAGAPPSATSADGKRVAFVRRDAEQPLSIWIRPSAGGDATKIFEVGTSKVIASGNVTPLARTSGISGLAFSTDGTRLYFQADGWGTSLALYALDLRSRVARLFLDANVFMVIPGCHDEKLRNDLIAAQHRYFAHAAGSYDWYFLFDARAHEIGPIGPELENVHRFLAKRCQLGESPPEPAPASVPVELAHLPRRCGDTWVTRRRTRFLDGTDFDAYFVRGVHDAMALAADADRAAQMLEPCTPPGTAL